MLSPADTIAAIATAPGEAGVAIVRISGSDAVEILARIFRARRREDLEPRRLHLGRVVHPLTAEVLDEAMACFLPPPQTYTREPVAEIHCHGGASVPQAVLEAALSAGARMAEPGEFTLRAFMAGRLDLVQAESLLDLVQARTESQRRLALQGLVGGLSERVRGLRLEALDLLARVTATIDFPEDDITEDELLDPLRTLSAKLEKLLATADQGALYRIGVRLAIAGPPNAGKSSLLNALLGRERAIVSAIPGTTRDTVEEAINLRGVPVVLIDTAGLRDARDEVERIGVERAHGAVTSADAALLVLDASEPLDGNVVERLPVQPVAVVLNKCDLSVRFGPSEVANLLPTVPTIAVSARAGMGLDDLVDRLANVLGAIPDPANQILLTNARHADALREADRAVTAALDLYLCRVTPDLMAAELRRAAEALGTITGETVTDELLATIFARFCVGK